jgi:serine/threonine protein phosphatase PrpC
MKERIIEEFNYELESNAVLDIFSTSGEEELNQDNFEVLTNKNLTVLILADGEGRSTMGDILSEMASSQALEMLDAYQFDKKSSEEIVNFLEKLLFTINNTIVEYLEVAKISDCSTTLSIALIYKNALFTAHIGKSRIYVIHRDETATLISKDPSYSKRISKTSLASEETSNFLGDPTLNEEKILVTHEADLYHKDIVFVCSSNLLESIPENKFSNHIEEIEILLENNPPLENASFLRYLHYERSVEVLRVEREETGSTIEDYLGYELDWEKMMPLLKKAALILGTFLIFGFFYLLVNDRNKTKNIETIATPNSEEIEIVTNEDLQIEKIEVSEERKVAVPVQEEELPRRVIPTIQHIPTISSNSTSTKKIQTETLRLLNKADSDVLTLGDDLIRITFKQNQLVGSKEGLFKEHEGDPQVLYCTVQGNTSLQGEIIEKLQKQHYSNSITIRPKNDEIDIRIRIKNSCRYTRSAWAKKSGLDLLTFSCGK